MSEAVFVALISGGLSLIGVIVTVVATMHKTRNDMLQEIRQRSDDSDAKLDKELALLRAEVDELMREVRIHNDFAQRVPVIEEQINVLNREMKEVKKCVNG